MAMGQLIFDYIHRIVCFFSHTMMVNSRKMRKYSNTIVLISAGMMPYVEQV